MCELIVRNMVLWVFVACVRGERDEGSRGLSEVHGRRKGERGCQNDVTNAVRQSLHT